MLASRFALLRALAWPHDVHHRWIDRQLRVNWELQSANVWCHLCLEYVTHLSFAALAWVVLPTPLVLSLVCVQTLVFLLLLRERGLDLNHRPRPIVEAAAPSVFCPAAYHALHHVYPNAHFSSYAKVVDAVLGTACELRSRRIAMLDGETPFGRALRRRLRVARARRVHQIDSYDDLARADVDILILCDPYVELAPRIEPYLRATQRRQLAPEVWAVRTNPADGIARH